MHAPTSSTSGGRASLRSGTANPVTSGSPAIDFFVSSELFETAVSIDAREVRRTGGTASDIPRAAATAAQAVEAGAETAYVFDEEEVDGAPDHNSSASTHASTTGSQHRQPGPQRDLRTISKHGEAAVEGGNGAGRPGWRNGNGDGEPDYTERLVLFDSLTASIPEVSFRPNAPSGTELAILAAAGASSSKLGSRTEERHLYHCIQHSKKFHPDFDPVLKGVLKSDPAARILLTAGSKVCFQCSSDALEFDETTPRHHVEVELTQISQRSQHDVTDQPQGRVSYRYSVHEVAWPLPPFIGHLAARHHPMK